jgi:hypothetical protein
VARAMVVERHAGQGTGRAMDELPDWPPGTAAWVAVSGPHAIPVSTAVRLAPRRLAFGLARRRETLARLRDEPAVALMLLAPGLAFSAYGTARVARDGLDAAPNVVAVAVEVERIDDHLEGARTEIVAAPQWRWTNDEAAEADARVRAELGRLV